MIRIRTNFKFRRSITRINEYFQ